MKKYYMNVYFSGCKKVEVEANNDDEAYDLAEEEVKKEIEKKIDFEELSVEAEYNDEEDLEEVIDYSEYIELQMLEEEDE